MSFVSWLCQPLDPSLLKADLRLWLKGLSEPSFYGKGAATITGVFDSVLGVLGYSIGRLLDPSFYI